MRYETNSFKWAKLRILPALWTTSRAHGSSLTHTHHARHRPSTTACMCRAPCGIRCAALRLHVEPGLEHVHHSPKVLLHGHRRVGVPAAAKQPTRASSAPSVPVAAGSDRVGARSSGSLDFAPGQRHRTRARARVAPQLRSPGLDLEETRASAGRAALLRPHGHAERRGQAV